MSLLRTSLASPTLASSAFQCFRSASRLLPSSGVAAATPTKKRNAFTFSPQSRQSQLNPRGQLNKAQHRSLSLHEYQSKGLLEKFGLNVQPGADASTPEEAYKVAKQLQQQGCGKIVIKCQVLAGGRGKGTLSSGLKGGVKICSTPEEIREYARQMLGYRLVTHQTTKAGELVKKVLVVNAAEIDKELYLALIMDRKRLGPVAVTSKMGGVEIEEVAESNPGAIKQHPIDIAKGMTAQDAFTIANSLGFCRKSDFGLASAAAEQIMRMYNLFVTTDATQVEINPLALVRNARAPKDSLVFIDAKLSFDDNAAYRQKDLFDQEDQDTMDRREVDAVAAGLNFVGLEGNVGCLVNGAGLAMSTMDIIQLHGGKPANFLDVGGGADEDQVKEAFRILQSDPNVKTLFVNIFGGIMRCDIIAQGLIEAAKSVDLRLPVVIRLVGNNVEVGKQLIENANFKNMRVVDDFDEAARTAVQLSR